MVLLFARGGGGVYYYDSNIRQHMEKPWRQLEDIIWETTYARQLRGHIYLGEVEDN